MAREDITGVEITCPKINEIIDILHCDSYFEDEKVKEDILIKLEEIRLANSQLRKFGNDLNSEKQQEILELECEISRLGHKVEDLKENLSLCNSDISTLQKEVEGKDSEISNLKDDIYYLKLKYCHE